MGTVPLFNPNNGLTGRDGGPYLDEVELVEAERRRAAVEQRKPDYEHPSAIAGVSLVAAGQLRDTLNSNSLPSQAGTDFVQLAVNKTVEDELGPKQVGERPDSAELDKSHKKAQDTVAEDFSGNPWSEDLVVETDSGANNDATPTLDVAKAAGNVETGH